MSRVAQDLAKWEELEDTVNANIKKWGLQDRPTLILAMQEELGEIARAHLEDTENLRDECLDLAALCYQLRKRIDADTAEVIAAAKGAR